MISTPVYIVTGASGSGKSTIVPELRLLLSEHLIFDMDILAGQSINERIDNWLAIAHSIALSNRSSVLCGNVYPWHIYESSISKVFQKIYYINLYCDNATREQRLKNRSWNEDWIGYNQEYARWMLNNAGVFSPPMPVFVTQHVSPRNVALEIRDWISNNM